MIKQYYTFRIRLITKNYLYNGRQIYFQNVTSTKISLSDKVIVHRISFLHLPLKEPNSSNNMYRIENRIKKLILVCIVGLE